VPSLAGLVRVLLYQSMILVAAGAVGFLSLSQSADPAGLYDRSRLSARLRSNSRRSVVIGLSEQRAIVAREAAKLKEPMCGCDRSDCRGAGRGVAQGSVC
jgi:hypothetical protein